MDRRSFAKKLVLTSGVMSSVGLSALQAKNSNMPNTPKNIYPNALKAGDKVALICPASPTSKEKLGKADENLRSLGLVPVYEEKIALAKNGYLAGSDELRLKALHAAFANPEIKGIWCVRGGYGTPRLLDKLDYKLIKKNPKVFIGFSDITALHVAIQQKTGLITFHGTVGVYNFPPFTVNYLNKTIFEKNNNLAITFPNNDSSGAYVINEGSARGMLTGGNLSLISSLVGTPYACEMKGKIVFLEEIEERPYRIDRMLTQLLLSGDLQQAAAIVLGVFDKCEADPNSDSLSLREMLTDRLGKLRIPVVYGFPFGHVQLQCVLPYGVEADLNTDDLSLTLLDTGVK